MDYAAQALNQLPDYMDGTELPSPLYFAALDSFLMNLRLLVDFWDVREHRRDRRDFYAVDFVANWSPEPAAAVDRLCNDNWWQLASEQVAHLSRQRVVPDPHDEASIRYDTSSINLRSIANDIRSIHGVWLRTRREEIVRRLAQVGTGLEHRLHQSALAGVAFIAGPWTVGWRHAPRASEHRECHSHIDPGRSDAPHAMRNPASPPQPRHFMIIFGAYLPQPAAFGRPAPHATVHSGAFGHVFVLPQISSACGLGAR